MYKQNPLHSLFSETETFHCYDFLSFNFYFLFISKDGKAPKTSKSSPSEARGAKQSEATPSRSADGIISLIHHCKLSFNFLVILLKNTTLGPTIVLLIAFTESILYLEIALKHFTYSITCTITSKRMTLLRTLHGPLLE